MIIFLFFTRPSFLVIPTSLPSMPFVKKLRFTRNLPKSHIVMYGTFSSLYNFSPTIPQAVINSISNLKRRSRPNAISHSSVGTVDEVIAREESRKTLNALRLTRQHIQHLTMPMDVMRNWGYIVDIPEGDGGTKPSEVGCTMTCERCNQPYMVKSPDQAEQCEYHWGKPFSKSLEGE